VVKGKIQVPRATLISQLYFGLLPPPQAIEQYPHSASSSRAAYTALRRRLLVAPDGRWASDCTGAEDHDAGLSLSPSTSSLSPLSSAGPSRPRPRSGVVGGASRGVAISPSSAADTHNDYDYASASPNAPPLGNGWDPLSLDGGSPWKTWFANVELRATIRQDVERTFPDIPYFEDQVVRMAMVTMLFLFSVLNPDVGYRQVSLVSDTLPPRFFCSHAS
jgi:TBC1 domain family protein 5